MIKDYEDKPLWNTAAYFLATTVDLLKEGAQFKANGNLLAYYRNLQLLADWWFFEFEEEDNTNLSEALNRAGNILSTTRSNEQYKLNVGAVDKALSEAQKIFGVAMNRKQRIFEHRTFMSVEEMIDEDYQ